MMSATARKSLATKLNGMIDVPFIGEQQEQMMAEVMIDKILEALCSDPDNNNNSSAGDAGLDETAQKTDVTTAEGASTMKKNMIKKINAKINLPFANEEQEAMILSVIVDMIFKEKFGEQTASSSSTTTTSNTTPPSAVDPVTAASSEAASST